MKNTLINLIFIFLLSPIFLQAQNNSTNFDLIKGQFIDQSTNKPVPSVNIFNENKRYRDFANDEGNFQIWAEIGDTLVLSAIGYLSLVFVLSDSILQENLIIKMEPRIYEIREATIKSIKKYPQFKQDFINLDLPRTALDSVTDELSKTAKKVIVQAEYDRNVKEVFAREKGTLFVIGPSIRSKKEKDKKALKKVRTNEEQQKIINQKYNYELVQKLTNLNDYEVTEFMLFCNFSQEFLVNANEYDIIKSITDKFEEYKKIHP